MITLEPVLLHIPCDGGETAVHLVRVTSAHGVAYGEAAFHEAEFFAPAVDFFGDAVAHTNPEDFNLTWQRLQALLREYEPDPLAEYQAVLGAIDMALWDLAGRRLETPCYRLAGGLRARRIDCHAGGLAIGQEDLEQAARKLQQQFGAVEVRLSGDAQRDVPAIHRLRRALGEHAPLVADAAPGYADLEAATRVGQALEQVEAFWYAHPLPAGRWEDYAHLRRTLGTGLAGGRDSSLGELQQALQAEACDLLIVDVRRIGGLSAARRAADLAELHGVRLSLHCGASPLAQVAAAQLAAANWHVGPLQVEPAPAPLGELLAPAPVFEDGFLRVPDGPGLGAQVQEALVTQYEVGLPDE